MDAPEPKRRFNRVGIALALVICLGTIPFTYQFQKSRVTRKSTVGDQDGLRGAHREASVQDEASRRTSPRNRRPRASETPYISRVTYNMN